MLAAASAAAWQDTPVVTLRWQLNQDGTLEAPPVVVNRAADPYSARHAESALRAVQDASPFNLPPDITTSGKTSS